MEHSTLNLVDDFSFEKPEFDHQVYLELYVYKSFYKK